MQPEPWRQSPPPGPEGEAMQQLLEDARAVEPWTTSQRALGWWRIADAAAAPKKRAWRFAVGGAVALAAVALVTFVIVSRPSSGGDQTWAAERLLASGEVLRVAAGARYAVADDKTVRLDAGRIEADARGAALTFVTPHGTLVVSGSRFLVVVEDGATSVQSFGGEVVVRGEAGRTLTLHGQEQVRSDDARLRPPEEKAPPAVLQLPPLHIEAPAATLHAPATQCDSKKSKDARASCLLVAARGNGLGAQTALFSLGLSETEAGRDARPRWEQYQARFPDGLFAPEVSLSLMSAHAEHGDRGAAIDEADRFLRRYPEDARAARVRAWRAALFESMKRAPAPVEEGR